MRDLSPDQLRHQVRKKLHGVLLPAISAQVVLRPEGARAYRLTEQEWKRAWAKGYGIKGSTEDVTDEVYLHFVWWVETQAVGRLGVRLPELAS
jgi:hypothetical protein